MNLFRLQVNSYYSGCMLIYYDLELSRILPTTLVEFVADVIR